MVRLTVALLTFLIALPAGVRADGRVIQLLEDRYTHVLMRHVGDKAEGEPEALGLADCSDRPTLNRHQKNLARRLGRVFERQGVHIDLIATSAWCSAIETAKTLKLRPVTVEPILNAAEADDVETADATLELLDSLRASEVAMLVTHEGNIRALTGLETMPGEIIIVRLRPGEDLEVRATWRPTEEKD